MAANNTTYVTATGNLLALGSYTVNKINGSASSEVLSGTASNDYIWGGGGGDVLVGKGGDDVYLISNSADQIRENAGNGIDTVKSYAQFYTLPANVENMYLGYSGEGNAQDNIMIGSEIGQSIDGGGGNDVLIGGGGSDTFVVRAGNGSDVITDFGGGAGNDLVRLDGYGFKSFADVQTALVQHGSDVVLTLSDDETLTFRHLSKSALTADNFQLSLDTSHMKQTFADDFDSFDWYDPAAKSGTWETHYGGDGRLSKRTLSGSTGEKEIYMDPAFAGTGTTPLGVNPFSINKGVLTITAENASADVSAKIGGYDYTSGMITTAKSFTQQYGYFEIRAELPDDKGAWPAFWLIDGKTRTEIDIMESLGDSSTAYQTWHSIETGKHESSTQTTHVYDTPDGFHTYGLSWTEQYLIWYIDGTEVRRVETPDDMKHPMYMILNLGVGGNWPGDPDPGAYNAQYKIDYVHVYQYDDSYSGTDYKTSSGSASSPSTGQTSDASSPTIPSSPPVVPDVPATPAVREVIGTAGDDTFTVVSSTDKFVETVNGGSDTVRSATTWTLGDNIEKLILTGNVAINGYGNALDNQLYGNAGSNHLEGGAGNDVLDGKLGADTLLGGSGNDIYFVDNAGDVIIEKANEGADVVISSVSFSLSDNVENLSLMGNTAISGLGNALDNRIVGNAGANRLDGGLGNDQIVGGDGNDVLLGGKGNDVLAGGKGSDVFVFSTGTGSDIVTDFSSKEGDRLDLTGFDHAKYTLSQVGNNVVFDFGQGDTVTVWGVSANDPWLLAHLHG